MRSPTSLAPALALAAGLGAAGCGTWSNEDIRFLEALPTREELRVVVPEGAAAAVASAEGRTAAVAPSCGPHGAAETWLSAKPTSDRLNASVDWILGLVDVVRRYPPTTRLDDGRIWGPFDDDRHPGIELRIVITRSWPAGPDGPVEHAYAFEARQKAAGGPFTSLLSGTFVGPSALRGLGTLVLRFDRIRALGMDDPDSPDGLMRVAYDRTADPRAVDLALLDTGGFGLARFAYAYRGYADGRGWFRFAFEDQLRGDRAVVEAGFDAAGAGQADVTFFPAVLGGASVGYHQCWDASACLTFSDDASRYSCGDPTGCAFGDLSACPPVPGPP
ncbi:MAG: hypothetical protein NDI82_07085 [Anaeromyxobacteraceae bacterium]|nr:hypothetical protein [Anaeromyxobacteraceae bacterium]